MDLIDSLYNRIESGRDGNNLGIPTGMPDLDRYTYGIQRRFMSTVFADSGAGKTTYTLFTHVYKPLQYHLEHPEISVEVLVFSLEMSAEVLLTKLLSLYILDTYHESVSFSEILSLGTILNDAKYKLVVKAKEWLRKIKPHLTIYDKAINADGVYTVVKSWAANFGSFDDSDDFQDRYIPNDPKGYKIVVVDHMRLLSGSDKKTEINKCADNLIVLRDLCDLTIALIQQANRQFKSVERRSSGTGYLQLDDLADASGPAQGSEIVIGIYFPYREKRVTCEDYAIKNGLGSNARLIQILKQRYGSSDIMKMVLFRGEIGYYKELPKPEEIDDYSKYLDLQYLFNSLPERKIEEVKKDKIETTSTKDLLKNKKDFNINFNFN